VIAPIEHRLTRRRSVDEDTPINGDRSKVWISKIFDLSFRLENSLDLSPDWSPELRGVPASFWSHPSRMRIAICSNPMGSDAVAANDQACLLRDRYLTCPTLWTFDLSPHLGTRRTWEPNSVSAFGLSLEAGI
jgi:hypothetical protein